MMENPKTQLYKRKNWFDNIWTSLRHLTPLQITTYLLFRAYGLDLNVVLFKKSYLTNRYLRKIGNSFSEWERIRAGVPQRSILGALLFNIFINDIFLYLYNSDLCNYVDDCTLYSSGESL